MMRVAIVTDSAAEFVLKPGDNGLVTVVPIDNIEIVSDPDGVTMSESPHESESSPGLFRESSRVAVASPKQVTGIEATLIRTYERLAFRFDAILSIHVSTRLSPVFEAARTAREEFRGIIPIEVFDSGVASAALGFVVQRLAHTAQKGSDLAELELIARRSAANVHGMFFAESVDYLNRQSRWARDRAWPIAGNGTRPLLNMEDGELRPIERVRTRARGYDRLTEFVELFPKIERLAVMHDTVPTELESVLRRIELLYPREKIVIGNYGPTMHAQIGPHGVGVFVDQGLDDD